MVKDKGSIRLIGAPTTAGCRSETAHLMDQANAPQAIRKAYTEMMEGFNIPAHFTDSGDLTLTGSTDTVLAAVTAAVEAERKLGTVPVILGGAHTVTLGTLRALAKTDGEFSVVYLDAHPDLMPRQEINYGSSIYHALKEGVIKPNRLAFLGIRHVELEEEEIILRDKIFARSAVDIATAGVRETLAELTAAVPPPYVVSIDFDAIDPAFAPGVTLPYPAGVTPREVLGIFAGLAPRGVITLELMELSPANDPDGRTLALAGEILYRTTKAISEAAA